MIIVPPADLTQQQWLLLQYLYKQGTSFYAGLLYQQFSAHHIERLYYYRLFFRLVASGYVIMESPGEKKPGELQDFRYTLTRKGQRTVADYSLDKKEQPIDHSFHSSHRTSTIIAAYLAKTILLRDYFITSAGL